MRTQERHQSRGCLGRVGGALFGAAAAMLTWATPALAEEPDQPAAENKGEKAPSALVVVEAPKGGAEEQGTTTRVFAHAPHQVTLGLGFRVLNVGSTGLDPYSRSDGMAMAAFFGSVSPWRTGPASLHVAGEIDLGRTSAEARRNPSSLLFTRLSAGLEGRWMPVSRITLFARAMPAAVYTAASVEDYELGKTLQGAAWSWALDTTAGGALRIGSAGERGRESASFWLSLDMGYSFSGDASLRLSPGDLGDDDLERPYQSVPMPTLNLSGFSGKLALVVSFL